MIPISGTLESTGLNRSGQTNADAKWLGFTSMQQNASTNANSDYIGDGGPNKIPSPKTPLANAVNTSNDTVAVDFPTEGTIGDGGANP